MRLLLAVLGGIPLSLAIERTRYVISGVVLTFVAYFLVLHLERCALVDNNTASRMSFWFPFAISAGLYLFADAWPLGYYLLLITVCIFGLLMPGDFLMKDHRFPSQ